MLKLELEFDKDMQPFNLKLVPQDGDDNDILHALTRNYCSVVNPAVIFSEDVKRGDYNSYTDAEYTKILAVYKKLSELFREEDNPSGKARPNGNVFELLIRLLNHYLSSVPAQVKHQAGSATEASGDISEAEPGEFTTDSSEKQCRKVEGEEKEQLEKAAETAEEQIPITESIVSENELPDIRAVAENYSRKTGCSKKDASEMLLSLLADTPATCGIHYYYDLVKSRKQKRKEPKT